MVSKKASWILSIIAFVIQYIATFVMLLVMVFSDFYGDNFWRYYLLCVYSTLIVIAMTISLFLMYNKDKSKSGPIVMLVSSILTLNLFGIAGGITGLLTFRKDK